MLEVTNPVGMYGHWTRVYRQLTYLRCFGSLKLRNFKVSCVSAAHLVFTEHKVSCHRPLHAKAKRGTYQRVDMMLLSIGYFVPAFGLKICCSHKASAKHCRIAVQSLGRVWGPAGLLGCLYGRVWGPEGLL